MMELLCSLNAKMLTMGRFSYGSAWESASILLEKHESHDAELLQEEEAEAGAEAEKKRPGAIMFTDGSRLDNRATEHAAARTNGQSWKVIKTHMGYYNQEAYDAECVALGRALESASSRNMAPKRVTIFTDAQAAIRRMASDESGMGQQYALLARRGIAALGGARPGNIIEFRWCPAHKGIAGNEKADEWEKIAAEEPAACGAEC